MGSIPARAGKPGKHSSAPHPPGVYPRTCGETLMSSLARASTGGLSPHVRGNRDAPDIHRVQKGSIPARAGKPEETDGGTCNEKVYPRTCGETSLWNYLSDRNMGLSPHVRGNRARFPLPADLGGSIPARAGKPLRANPIIILYFLKNVWKLGSSQCRFKSNTPPASTISLGGSPSVSIRRCPEAVLSRHTITIAPRRSVPHQDFRTAHTRSRTATDSSGAA